MGEQYIQTSMKLCSRDWMKHLKLIMFWCYLLQNDQKNNCDKVVRWELWRTVCHKFQVRFSKYQRNNLHTCLSKRHPYYISLRREIWDAPSCFSNFIVVIWEVPIRQSVEMQRQANTCYDNCKPPEKLETFIFFIVVSVARFIFGFIHYKFSEWFLFLLVLSDSNN